MTVHGHSSGGILMVEKLTFNSLATALVDITAVSMPIALSLKNICVLLHL
jgi:hypothetical protein